MLDSKCISTIRYNIVISPSTKANTNENGNDHLTVLLENGSMAHNQTNADITDLL